MGELEYKNEYLYLIELLINKEIVPLTFTSETNFEYCTDDCVFIQQVLFLIERRSELIETLKNKDGIIITDSIKFYKNENKEPFFVLENQSIQIYPQQGNE